MNQYSINPQQGYNIYKEGIDQSLLIRYLINIAWK